MALVACRECGHQVSTEANACPKCGARVPRTKWWLWVPIGLVAAFLGFGAMVGGTPEAQEKSQQQAAVRLCWDEQSRKSLSPDAARLAAGAYEMMEARFRDRWGHHP